MFQLAALACARLLDHLLERQADGSEDASATGIRHSISIIKANNAYLFRYAHAGLCEDIPATDRCGIIDTQQDGNLWVCLQIVHEITGMERSAGDGLLFALTSGNNSWGSIQFVGHLIR